MPETPDFEQIARQLKLVLDDHPQLSEQNVRLVVEHLTLIWNARGAADLATIEATITYALSQTAPGLVSYLDRAIKSLDR